MSSLTLLVAVFLLLPKQAQLKPLVMSTFLPTPTGAKGCEYYGKMYEPGVIFEEQCHGASCVELDGHYEVLYWHKFKWCTLTSTTALLCPLPSFPPRKRLFIPRLLPVHQRLTPSYLDCLAVRQRPTLPSLECLVARLRPSRCNLQ